MREGGGGGGDDAGWRSVEGGAALPGGWIGGGLEGQDGAIDELQSRE
jgi:hypothetical protein